MRFSKNTINYKNTLSDLCIYNNILNLFNKNLNKNINFMENQRSNSSLKAIVVVLALLLAGSLYYIFTLTNDAKQLQTEIKAVKSEK